MTTIAQLEATLADLDREISAARSSVTSIQDRIRAEIAAEVARIEADIKARHAAELKAASGVLNELIAQKQPIEQELIERRVSPHEGKIVVGYERRRHSWGGAYRYFPVWYKVVTVRSWEDISDLTFSRFNRRPDLGTTILRRVDAKGNPLKSWEQLYLDKDGEIESYHGFTVDAIRPLNGKDKKGLYLGYSPSKSDIEAAFRDAGVL